MLNEDSFITGGEDGAVSLWHSSKKKAVVTMAHAQTPHDVEISDSSGWVSAVAACRYTDLAASGAADGTDALFDLSLDQFVQPHDSNETLKPCYVGQCNV